MEDAGGVGDTESGAGADPDPDGQVGLERPLVEQLTDAAALHQLGDDEASVLVRVVDGGRVGVPDQGVPGQDGEKRARNAASAARWGWTTLTATGWSSTRSWPSQTWPTGPAPASEGLVALSDFVGSDGMAVPVVDPPVRAYGYGDTDREVQRKWPGG